jgi:hypothetical protein
MCRSDFNVARRDITGPARPTAPLTDLSAVVNRLRARVRGTILAHSARRTHVIPSHTCVDDASQSRIESASEAAPGRRDRASPFDLDRHQVTKDM